MGRLMTPDFVRVRPHWTVAYALAHIRRYGNDSETMGMVYVIDGQDKLIDDLRIRQILLASPRSRVSDLMDSRFVSLKATDHRAAAVEAFKQADLIALPVTDTEGALIGIVTVDDILHVAEAQATRDIQKIGGSEALDEPYMRVGLPQIVRKRATWLVILFLSEMLTATAMGHFETEIARAVVLSIFVPLVISSGGNSGSQASTLIIRAMAVGEVRLRDWWRVMRREILAGLSLGTILGTIGFVRISTWALVFHSYGQHWLLLALTVGNRVDRHRTLGVPGGFDAAVRVAPHRRRSGDLLGALRRHVGGCLRPDHLLHHRGGHLEGHPAVAQGRLLPVDRCRSGILLLRTMKSRQRSLLSSPVVWAVFLSLLWAIIFALDLIPYLRGGTDWAWNYKPELSRYRLAPLILGVVVYVPIALWLRRQRSRTGLLIWAIFGGLALSLAAVHVRGDVLYRLYTITVSGRAAGWHMAAARIQNLSGTLSDWPQFMRNRCRFPHTLTTRPPELWSLYYSASLLLDQLPTVAAYLAQPLRWLLCQYLTGYTNGQYASAWLGMLMPLWGSLTVLPLYSLGRRVYGLEAAAWSVVWWPLVPSFLMFDPLPNTVYALPSILVIGLLWEGLSGNRPVQIVAAGVLMSILTFLTFTFAPLLLFAGLLTLGVYWMRTRRPSGPRPRWYWPFQMGLWFFWDCLLYG